MKKNGKMYYPVRGWCLPQWLLFMRNLFVLLLVCSIQLYASENTLAQKVTLKMSNTTLKAIIEAIEQQTRLGFLYNEKEIADIRHLNVDVNGQEVKEVLDELLKDSPLIYRLDNQTILLSPRAVETVPQEIQTWLIKGKVTDSKKVALPGVSVCIKGTTLGVATNEKGEYALEIPATKGTILTFSFIGMKVKESTVNDSRTLNIVLDDDSADLDEVTVIAYGERKKREMISAISSVKAEDLKEIPSSSFENLLQGHMAGVEITNVAGSPGGGGTRVNVRGYNSLLIKGVNDGSPLYVVDGVPVNSFTSPVTGTNTLAEIDPSTIASVEVLKDAASAAIYGSRASNGVILITTKQGQSGKGKFSANVSYSYSILPETPLQISGNGERAWHRLAGHSQITAYSEYDPVTGNYVYKIPTSYEEVYGKYDGMYDFFWQLGQTNKYGQTFSPNRALQDSLNPFYNNSTNWWKYVFRAGKVLNANLQASGGTERVKYMVGAGWYDEAGIMLGSNFKRANIISNLNITPRQNLNFDVRLYLSYSDRSKGAASTGFSSASKIEGMMVSPVGTSTLLPGSGVAHEQLLKALNESSEKNFSYTLRANAGLSYEFIKGLKLRATIAADYNYSKKNSFSPSTLDQQYGLSLSSGQSAANMMLQNEELLTYRFTIGEDHNFDLLGGFSYSRKATDMMAGSGKGSPSDKIHYVPIGFDELKEINGNMIALKNYTSDFQEQVMASYFGRIAYNFRQKYLTEFTFRRDGSSTFGEKERWANFPSIAVGWAFSEENFMKDLWWLSYGKLRGSWGTSGQVFADSYLAHGTLGVGQSFLGNTGIKPTSTLNDRLTWEESDQYDIGLDVDLLDYRLKFKLDYYYKYSKSLLFKTDLPGNVYGQKDSWQNAMEISNEGLELEASFDIFRESAVSWRARFNISRNWNRFEKSYTGMDLGRYVIGRPIFGLYVYKAGKIIQTEEDVPKYWKENGNYEPLCITNGQYAFRPGMRLIEDLNGDGKITDDDRYYAGSALPVAYGGFANEVKWKGFDLNVLFTYTLGRKLINLSSSGSLAFTGQFGAIYTDYRNMEFWEKPGDNANPTISASSNSYNGQFDGYRDDMIEKVNWLRLKQLTLGYNVPENIIKKLNIEGVRVFFTAENLFLLTNYSGIDPEAVDQAEPYDNMRNYPLARKLTVGLTLNF